VPGRTPREAVKAYLEQLQKIISIVSQGVLRVSNYDTPEVVSVLTLPDPAPLNGRPDLCLSFTQQYKIVKNAKNEPFRVTTLYYSYAVETQDAQEIVGYHWHPDGVSPVRFPHLHLGPAACVGLDDLRRKAHLPTGRVAFEEVIELLIATFGVEPDRTLWQDIVDKTRSVFARHKTW
jgi:hypothetical protein